jgi:lon-related putative ATP-dependent protease
MPLPPLLAPDQTRLRLDAAALSLDPDARAPSETRDIVGQTRALRALDYGFGLRDPRCHLFVAGPAGTGRTGIVPARARTFAAGRPTPPDWVCVHSFRDPQRPLALRLPAGQGRALAREMKALLETLQRTIPAALNGRDFRSRYQAVLEQAQDDRRVHLDRLEARARALGIGVEDNDQNVRLMALDDAGRPLSAEAYQDLPEDERRAIEERERTLRDDILEYLDHARQIQDAADDRLDRLQRKTVGRVVQPAMQRLRKKLPADDALEAWLHAAQETILDDPWALLPQEEEHPLQRLQGQDALERFEVNVLIDHAQTEGGPVVVEWHPTWGNLIGRIERRMSMGALETSHMLVRAGGLLRASGGVLICSAPDLLQYPAVYNALKRALREGLCTIEESEESASSPGSTATLRPIPIPIDVRVVLIGTHEDWAVLQELDEDFAKLFKVRADFGETLPLTPDAARQCGLLLVERARDRDLLPLTPDGLAALLEESSRIAGRRDALSLRFSELTDFLQEVDHWARIEGRAALDRDAVLAADRERRERDGLFREEVLRQFERGTLLVQLEGSRIGQVNGLAVLAAGTFDIGMPSRITARSFSGSQGLVNIERETNLSGQIHSKAVLILQGYLGALYAQQRPLALSASITFEQNYSQIEGDSASIAEAIALLSSVAEVGVRQDIAVTGSMSQHGEVQSVGGISEKIEGFFDVCALRGLTGTQGVVLPATNVGELHLPLRIVDAIEAGRFHLWTVRHLDEALHLLTGIDPGERRRDGTFPARSLHGRIQRRLTRWAERDTDREDP